MSNSNPPPKPSVAGTLTGGIQDISAILPIIGTDQCEKHVGSALTAGFLYAAAAPLSIFGSLGIIKVAIGILIASISIPKFWVSHRDLKPSGRNGKGKQSMIFGAELLQNIGYQLAGNVAPLIGMDGTRFKAESRLIQTLEEKHINDPDRVLITWKSTQWNIMLVFFTMIAAAMSGIPYFALLLGPPSWRPTTHLPWLFPFLRTVGSCLASVCCQFIIQSRVISTMKNRILFMTIDRELKDRLSADNNANLDDWLKYHLQWDPELPAEQCVRNLGRALSIYEYISEMGVDVQPTEDHVVIDMDQENPPPKSRISWMYRRSSTPSALPPPKPHLRHGYNRWEFKYWLKRHFPTPKRDRVIAFISWVVLFLSLPATIAGYVGCFTLVSSTPSPGNGPLVWLGLEAALSIIRILIWAWNPKFDEDTDMTVEIDLDNDRPSDCAEELNGFVNDVENKKSKSLPLRPEQQFLEAITTYTGPFDQFQRSDNIALYYALMADESIRLENAGTEYITPVITVIDFNTGLGVTLLQLGGSFYYFDTDVNHDAALIEMSATVSSTMRNIYPWQTQMRILFDALEQHYTSLVTALNLTGEDIERRIAKLERKWDLSIRPQLTSHPSSQPSFNLSLLYPDHRYEHTLKTNLIQLWGRWIAVGMEYRAMDARNDCYEALEDQTRKKAKWELTELDRLLAEEWVFREQVVVACSLELEDILQTKIDKSINQLGAGQEDEKLKVWMKTGFVIGRRKRLENDRGAAQRRMKEAMNRASALAERERRSWREQGQFAPKWQEGIEFIDALWSEGISEEPRTLKHVEANINTLARMDTPDDVEETPRHDCVAQVAQRFKHWRPQHENERREMEATIALIRSVDGQRDQLDSAYEYPEFDYEAPSKFVSLKYSKFAGKACTAIVYDGSFTPPDIVFDVIKKSTTRSVINIDPEIVASIPPNDHLLFLSCRGQGEEPAFVQHNRDRWWDQQMTNSALFYFTPQQTSISGRSCRYSNSGRIAQVLIFVTTLSRVRLRLLHSTEVDPNTTISVQENGRDLFTLSDGIPETNFKLQTLEIGELRLGRHELQVVAYIYGDGYYDLRDILIDFLDCPPQSSPVPEDKDQSHEIQPIILAASDEEHELDNGFEHPLPLLDGQNSGSEDRSITRISDEAPEYEQDNRILR